MLGFKLEPGQLAVRGGGPGPRDWRFAAGRHPSFSLTRTGAGTAFALDGRVLPFASGQPRLTDRGLLQEGAATNLMTRFAPTAAQIATKANAADTLAPANAPMTGLDWIALDNTSALAYAYAPSSAVPASTRVVMTLWVETPDGSPPAIGPNAGSDFDLRFHLGQMLTDITRAYRRLSGHVWECRVTGTTPGGVPGAYAGPYRQTNYTTRLLRFCGLDLQVTPSGAGTSPIVTTGASATRGADSASLTVPAGCAHWEAEYGTAGTASGSGLTPGGTFDLTTGRPWIGLGNELKRVRFF